MANRINTFLEFLKAKYYNTFYNSSHVFLLSHKKLIIDKHFCDANYITEIEIDELDFKNVWIEDKPNDVIEFDVAIEVEFSCTIYNGRYHDYETLGTSMWIMISCKGNLSSELKDLKVIGVDEFVKGGSRKPLSGDLVPIIRREEYDKYAEEILLKYYPEALETNNPIDVKELAKRMGLRLINTRITKDKSIFGQLFFKKTNVTLYSPKEKIWREFNIPANTIIVDASANFLYSFGSINMTIAHECVHYALHKKAFLFSQLIYKDLQLLQCEVKGGIRGISTDSKSIWMEIQANGIAPYLLLPTKTFKSKVIDVLNYYEIKNDLDLLSNIESVIKELASYYKVTTDAIRRRMIDIGYEEAAGSFNYVDGSYVKPYRYPKHALLEQKVYSIQASELKFILTSNRELDRLVKDGHYLYVDSHLVANFPKYLVKNENGLITLSDYARENIDECCVSFKVEYENRETVLKDFYSICYLNKNINVPIGQKVVFNNGYENSKDTEARNEYYRNAIKEEQEFFLTLTQSFTDCLKKIKAWRGKTNEWISNKMLVSEKSVERILSGEQKPTYPTLCAYLLALKTPYSISQHIESLAPHGFDAQNIEHWHLRQLLKVNNSMEMEQIREEAKKLNVTL